MARSKKIYLVYVDNKYHKFPLAVFTVKHEAVTYISTLPIKWQKQHIKLYSMPDGYGESPYVVTELAIE